MTTVQFYINYLTKKYNVVNLSRKELAAELGISLTTLMTVINDGQLPIRYIRLGLTQKARYLFPIVEVAHYLAFENPEAA